MKKLFEWLAVGYPKNIDDLKRLPASFKVVNRDSADIAIIDDDKFHHEDLLKDHGFKITKFDDITNIRELSEYAIVLCDIRGVGKKFKSTFEGAHLISEIKKRYPAKIIYAYTGVQYDVSFNRYFEVCDGVLKKDIDIDEWVECLDRAIQQASDPIEQWLRLRSHLLAAGVPIFHLALLEDDYTRCFESGTASFPSSRTKALFSGTIQDLIINFSATAFSRFVSL